MTGEHHDSVYRLPIMSAVHVVEIDATSPELSAGAVLFDCYRTFYGQPRDLSLAKRYLRERLEAGESTVLLARVRDRWVGFCQLYQGFSSIDCARIIILNDLYVDDGHRGVGVGRALIDHARERGQRAHAVRLVLETAETNVRAQALYESLGFERARGFVGYSLCLQPT